MSSSSRTASACFAPVMSRAIFDAPMIVPCSSRSGEMVTETSSNRPVLRPAHRLEVVHPLAPPQPRQDHRLFVLPIFGQQAQNRLSDHLLRPVAEDALRGRIPAGDHPGERFTDDGVIRGVHDGGEPQTRLLRLFALGDITRKTASMNEAFPVPQDVGANQDGLHRAILAPQARLIVAAPPHTSAGGGCRQSPAGRREIPRCCARHTPRACSRAT